MVVSVERTSTTELQEPQGGTGEGDNAHMTSSPADAERSLISSVARWSSG